MSNRGIFGVLGMGNSSTDSSGRDFDDPEYGNYGIKPGRGGDIRPNRMQKFGQALEAAAAYKDKKKIDAEVDKEKDEDKDVVGPKGFKIDPNTTVVSGYRDPGFTLAGQQGRSLLGPIGAGVGIFNPALGKGISAVGSLTGL